jgi:hypothetical protein
MKKALIVITLFGTILSSVFSSYTSSNNTILQKYDTPDLIIYDLANKIVNKDTNGIMSLYEPSIRNTRDFSSCIKDSIGIMSILKMSIHEIKQITKKQATTISAYISYNDVSMYKKNNVFYYYVGYLQEVSNETDLYWNGIVYEIYLIVKQNDNYYILDNQFVYDFDIVISEDCAFNSIGETQAAYVQDQHYKGNLINYYNELIIPYEPYIIDGSIYLREFSDEEILKSKIEAEEEQKKANIDNELKDPIIEKKLLRASLGASKN